MAIYFELNISRRKRFFKTMSNQLIEKGNDFQDIPSGLILKGWDGLLDQYAIGTVFVAEDFKFYGKKYCESEELYPLCANSWSSKCFKYPNYPKYAQECERYFKFRDLNLFKIAIKYGVGCFKDEKTGEMKYATLAPDILSGREIPVPQFKYAFVYYDVMLHRFEHIEPERVLVKRYEKNYRMTEEDAAKI